MLRFTPSQTDKMTISDLRIAIFNYIVSKQLNEDLIIRIEDRIEQDGKEKEILEILNLFSIEYKNAFYQSDNLKYHQKLAMQLLTQKKAHVCFCSDEKLKELENEAKEKGKTFSYDGFCETLSDETVLNTNAPFTIRIKKPTQNIKFNDILKGDFEYTPQEIDSFVILKHDKTPTFNYSCAIDDMLTNISMLIQDEDELLNSARQIYIRQLLAYDKEFKYIHVPKVLTQEDDCVYKLIDEGFLPSAIANYLVLLGNETPTEIFTLEEAIKWFKIENISKKSVNFDIEKLKNINKNHIQTLDDMRLSKILGFADEDIGKLAKFYLEEVNTIKELKNKIQMIFTSKTTPENFEKDFIKVKESIKNAPFFNDFADLKKYIQNETLLEEERLEESLTYLFTGSDKKRNISDIYSLIKNYLGEIVK